MIYEIERLLKAIGTLYLLSPGSGFLFQVSQNHHRSCRPAFSSTYRVSKAECNNGLTLLVGGPLGDDEELPYSGFGQNEDEELTRSVDQAALARLSLRRAAQIMAGTFIEPVEPGRDNTITSKFRGLLEFNLLGDDQASTERPGLMEVRMKENGESLILPPENAQQLIQSGAAVEWTTSYVPKKDDGMAPTDADQQEELVEVELAGNTLFLPKAEADALNISGYPETYKEKETNADRVEKKRKPKKLKDVEPTERVRSQLLENNLALDGLNPAVDVEVQSQQQQEDDLDLIEVEMGSNTLLLPREEADALILSGSAQALEICPDYVQQSSSDEFSGLMAVDVGGSILLLPASETQRLISLGSAKKAALTTMVSPSSLSSSASPEPAAAYSFDEQLKEPVSGLIPVDVGGSTLLLPSAEAQRLISQGSAQEAAFPPMASPSPPLPAASPEPAVAYSSEEQQLKESATIDAALEAAYSSIKTPTTEGMLKAVCVSGRTLLLPAEEARHLLAQGMVAPAAPERAAQRRRLEPDEDTSLLAQVVVGGRPMLLPAARARAMVESGAAAPLGAAPGAAPRVVPRAPAALGGAVGALVPRIEAMVEQAAARGVARALRRGGVCVRPVRGLPVLVEVSVGGQNVKFLPEEAEALKRAGVAQEPIGAGAGRAASPLLDSTTIIYYAAPGGGEEK